MFPELFSGANDWHLMGGLIGGDPVSQGPITDALTMLEEALADSSEPFRNAATALHVGDLISHFSEVTLLTERICGSHS